MLLKAEHSCAVMMTETHQVKDIWECRDYCIQNGAVRLSYKISWREMRWKDRFDTCLCCDESFPLVPFSGARVYQKGKYSLLILNMLGCFFWYGIFHEHLTQYVDLLACHVNGNIGNGTQQGSCPSGQICRPNGKCQGKHQMIFVVFKYFSYF